MEKPIKEVNRDTTVNLERRYIRLQVVGMSFWLSIPVAMMLAAMFGIDSIMGQIATSLFVVGCVFFFFGSIGRRELAEPKERFKNSDNNDIKE